MRPKRLYHSCRLLMYRTSLKRAQYMKKHNILGGMGEDCRWGPWLVPLYPELIVLHNNVHVHKTAKLVTHDLLNRFLTTRDPSIDYGHQERVGCIELMDNVYISMGVTIMPNVRIGKDTIVSANSVVTSDIPENSIASGNPATPTGRFDMFNALRRMGKSQTYEFENQKITEEVVKKEWERFKQRRDD